MMTSSMTSQGGLKVCPLYSFINETTLFFVTIKKLAKISSLNFLCMGIMQLWLHWYKCVFMTSLMTSPGQRVGQILNWYVSVNIWARASIKISKCTKSFLSGIFNFRYNFWKIVYRELKMPAIKKIWKYQTQLQFNLRYERIVPNYAKKVFSWWWRHRWRHRMAPKFPSIFMFMRGWLQEQVAKAMSRQ